MNIVLLIIVGIAAYANSLSTPFLFEDIDNIVLNPHIRHLWPLTDVLFGTSGIGVAGRPVVTLSLAINYALGHLDVRGYHMFNVIIHILSALTLFGIVRHTLRAKHLRARYGFDASRLALVVSFLWMAHPLLTESVIYVTQRTELLMGLFALFALYCLIRSASPRYQLRWQVMAVISCILGVGSKEVMVIVPLVILLYDRVFLAFSFRKAFRARPVLYVGLAISLVLFVTLQLAYHRTQAIGMISGSYISWSYARTQCAVILHYIRLAFWPYPLVFDYQDWPIANTTAEVLPQIIIIALLLAATVWTLRIRPAVGFLGAWFFLLLAPSSSVFPIFTEVAAERRMYLPLCAIIVLVVVGGWNLLQRLRLMDVLRRALWVGCVTAVVGILAIVLVRRNMDYTSNVTIWSDAVAKRPQNARAHNYFGAALAAKGKLKEAISEYEAAIRLKPDHAFAHNNLGLVLCQQERFDEANAQYEQALVIMPSYAEAHNNLGACLMRQGMLDIALAHYEQALRLKPDSAIIKNNLNEARAKLREAEAPGSVNNH